MNQTQNENNFQGWNKDHQKFVYLMLAISVLNQTTNFVQGIFYKVFTQKLLISEGLSNLCYALSSIVYMFAGILSTNIY